MESAMRHVLFFVLNYTVQYLNLLINIRINTNTNKKYFYIMIRIYTEEVLVDGKIVY